MERPFAPFVRRQTLTRRRTADADFGLARVVAPHQRDGARLPSEPPRSWEKPGAGRFWNRPFMGRAYPRPPERAIFPLRSGITASAEQSRVARTKMTPSSN